MDIFSYLRKNNIDTIDSSFYSLIDAWNSWYNADVPHFHRYSIYNGRNKIRCRRLSLNMGKQLCEDMANLLLNEKTIITVANEATSDFINQTLTKNNWNVKGNQMQELKSAVGTVAYVCQVDNARVTEDGSVIDGRIKINYVDARDIFPVSWENGEISECIFRFRKVVKGKVYFLLQYHHLNEYGTYVIENRVVKDNNGSGSEIDPDKWEDLPPFKNMSAIVETGDIYPQFVIDTLNIANNADIGDSNPMGVSIYANALGILQSIDLKYDSYANEFELGKKRVFVAPEMIENENGDPVFDENDVVFYQLPEDSLSQSEPIREVNMNLRIEEHSKAIGDDLKLLSMRCGFGTGRYEFDKGMIQTATEVISKNSDMFRTIVKHEIVLHDVLEKLYRTIARIGKAIGNPGIDPDCEIIIEFDDSIVEDKESERASDRSDVAMGAMSLVEYRMKWYGETEEEAAKHVVDDSGVIE